MRKIVVALTCIFTLGGTMHAQQDTTSADTLGIPRLVVKASISPLLSVFVPETNADIGAEIRVRKHYSLDFHVGVTTRSLFQNRYLNSSGYYGLVNGRRYFLNKNGLYLNAGFAFGRKSKSHTVEFSANGGYSKRTRVTRDYRGFYPAVGWHGSVFERNKYPLDFCIGLLYESRVFSFTNLTRSEIELVRDGETEGIEDFPDRDTRVGVMFWLKIGLVAIR